VSITDNFLVTGQVAIITGAGRGIGAASALALAEAGADLVISARTEAQLEQVADQIRAFGRRVVTVTADLSDLDSLPTLVAAAVDQLGRLDIVVNNVGGSFPQPLLDTSIRSFEKAFHFNVTTALALSQAAIPTMVEQGSGSIVNIGSAIGRMPDRGFVAYGTAKGALAHMTRLMAADCAPKVRVNGIAVGSVATSALEVVLTNDELRTQMEDGTPLGRLGDPLDIALGVLYLCSPAGAFLTGKMLEIDGGLSTPNLALGLPDL
jgi:7-alpha-hydroxysteroid dehydrogenase